MEVDKQMNNETITEQCVNIEGICLNCLQNNFILCCKCSNLCERIGEKNQFGFRKSYCCFCFSLIDSNFDRSKWCETCKEHNSESEQNDLKIRASNRNSASC